jgi:hypothetical protein
MQKKYSSLSPYFLTEVSGSYLDVMQNRPIPKYIDDVVFAINKTYHRRPDLLAYDLYGDSRLWWVFAQRNPNTLVDPLGDFAEGTEIWVPNINTLKQTLGF